jgi:2,4-dienoyl-CoA reductase-like NADH-dependent reductase (Old Yellow Enzyme family)
MREDSIVFTSARIGQLEIKNRLVRSATYENGSARVSRLRAALKAAYLAGESPAPGIAYLPG